MTLLSLLIFYYNNMKLDFLILYSKN